MELAYPYWGSSSANLFLLLPLYFLPFRFSIDGAVYITRFLVAFLACSLVGSRFGASKSWCYHKGFILPGRAVRFRALPPTSGRSAERNCGFALGLFSDLGVRTLHSILIPVLSLKALTGFGLSIGAFNCWHIVSPLVWEWWLESLCCWFLLVSVRLPVPCFGTSWTCFLITMILFVPPVGILLRVFETEFLIRCRVSPARTIAGILVSKFPQ